MSRAKNLSKTRAQLRKRPQPGTSPETARLLTGTKLKTLLGVLLAATTIALYSPVIGHSFVVLDDRDYVTANSHIHGGLGWSTIKWAFTSTEAANWHPLTWLSHAFDYQLFALNPAGHHFDSVLMHAMNAVLLFLLLAWTTERVGPSLLVAALFALHPLNVESVAWVAERKNVLSTWFFLLAIAAYAWYAKKPDWRRYLLVAALFAAGLMAKPMVITLPFVLLLLDYWPLERMPLNGTESGSATANGVPRFGFSRLLLEKVPLLILSAASAWITLIAQRTSQAVRTLEELSLGIRIENAVVSYGLYLWKMLWPARLALYPLSAIALPAWQWLLSALLLISVTTFVVIFRRKRYLPVGWFWFLGTLVPVIGLVQVGEASMADRYAYLPLIGIFIIIAWSLDDWAEGKKVRTVWRVLSALCALAALSGVTSRQMSYWASQYTMLTHTLAVTDPERSAYLHDALGTALLNPGSSMTKHDLENFNTGQERLDEARRQYEQALDLRRQLPQQNQEPYAMALALSNLGQLDGIQNRSYEARRHYEEALNYFRQLAQQNPGAYQPNVAETLMNLGNHERAQNQIEVARQHYEQSSRIYRQLAKQDPDRYLPWLARTLYNTGRLDRLQSRVDEARQHWEEALKIYRQLSQQDSGAYLPYLAVTLNDLGNLDRFQNRTDDARQHYEDALQSFRQLAQQKPDVYLPSVAETLNNLGFLESNQNRIEESRVHFTEAMTFYRKLAQSDPEKYADDVARVAASLQELDKKSNSR
ncbi:MAG: tetratricopeptide repeat protein [Terriglobales bacterium]